MLQAVDCDWPLRDLRLVVAGLSLTGLVGFGGKLATGDHIRAIGPPCGRDTCGLADMAEFDEHRIGVVLRHDPPAQHRTAEPRIEHQFDEAYGHGPDRANLLDAIATYERSLVTPGSRFDRWLQGDATALSAKELRGYQLFKSLGCVSCHQGVNIGGNLFERHGIFHPLASPKPEILRVPSLRNVAVMAPYFHDGSAKTLHEAIREMAFAQLDDTLTEQQIDTIEAFLRTLTGTYRGVPVRAASP
jgi:cytochrome c peroxidase